MNGFCEIPPGSTSTFLSVGWPVGHFCPPGWGDHGPDPFLLQYEPGCPTLAATLLLRPGWGGGPQLFNSGSGALSVRRPRGNCRLPATAASSRRAISSNPADGPF